MELQLPGRPSELEKAGVPGENKRTQTGAHHALSYTNIYICESGGGANWTPLHEFSCVP